MKGGFGVVRVNKGVSRTVGFGMGIEIIAGSMFSGKSEELIRRVKRSIVAGQKVQVFKPSIDTRRSLYHVTTYDGIRIDAFPVGASKEILEKLEKSTDVVAIDEAQFFDESIIETVDLLAKMNKIVIISCLNLDFRGEPFPLRDSKKNIGELITRADTVDKLTGICTHKIDKDGKTTICGSRAVFTQRIIDGKPATYDSPTILLGSQEAYEARCRDHFIIPGKPENSLTKFIKF